EPVFAREVRRAVPRLPARHLAALRERPARRGRRGRADAADTALDPHAGAAQGLHRQRGMDRYGRPAVLLDGGWAQVPASHGDCDPPHAIPLDPRDRDQIRERDRADDASPGATACLCAPERRRADVCVALERDRYPPWTCTLSIVSMTEESRDGTG